MSHPMKPTPNREKLAIKGGAPPAPQWPSFRGKSEFVGSSASGRLNVFVDPALGADGLQNAQDLVKDGDRVANSNDAIFGTTGGAVSVIVFALGGRTDGTGGADHMGCDYTTGNAIEVCASFGNSARVTALFEAELSECSMGGNLCGVSTGEALSRWCAEVTSNNALSDFATAPAWAQDGMPDFVNKTAPTDQDANSTGCGMAFISWLMSQGVSLSSIAQALVSLGETGTFAQLYANLTSNPVSNAWPAFQAAVKRLPNGVTNDDPFGAAAQSAQLAYIPPLTAPLAGRVFASILTDIAAAKEPHQIVASVQAIMAAAHTANIAQAAAVGGPSKSRRLLPPDKTPPGETKVKGA
ncbi:MAG TPA: hypothetical protein VFN26_15720 [Candidatus Acidoferrum sp.]|nr:hypothetical protein [Candidatus Acidoferrum sp.]